MTHLSDFDENFDENFDEDGDWDDTWENDSIEINHILECKTNDLHNIKIYNSQNIENIINSEIENFSEYLGNITHDESFYLLMKHNWNKDKATEDFCNNGIHISDIVKIDIENKKLKQCMVCFDDILPINQLTICNEHFFCKNCWNGYLTSQINDGNTNMRCMDPKCTKHVTYSFIRTLFNKNPKILCKYFTWIINSFVQYKNTYKYCPNPKCELISFNNDDENKTTCTCGTTFCFSCHQNYHFPASCSVINLWNKKCNKDSENALWLMENTKNCPKCKISIEKNHGCNHMTCENCKHQFCWLCKEDWKKHGTATGGFYKCNVFIEMEKNNQIVKEDYGDERFLHYFSRYKNHNEAREIFCKKIEKINYMLEKDMTHEMAQSISFEHNVKDSISVLLDCRETLKWSYSIGYSIEDKLFKELFEFWQQNLEKYCEYLNSLIEVKTIYKLWSNNTTISNTMRTTKKYHKNLCNKLSEIGND